MTSASLINDASCNSLGYSRARVCSTGRARLRVMAVPLLLLALILSWHTASAQVGCQHLGNQVQCPAGVADGSNSVTFQNGGLNILWSDNTVTLTSGCCQPFVAPITMAPTMAPSTTPGSSTMSGGGVPQTANRDIELLPLFFPGVNVNDVLDGPGGYAPPGFGFDPVFGGPGGPVDFTQGPYTFSCFDDAAGGRCSFYDNHGGTPTTTRSRTNTSTAAANERLRQAQQTLSEAEREHKRQLDALQAELDDARWHMNWYASRKRTAQANLTSHRKDESIFESIDVFVRGDRRTTMLEARISVADEKLREWRGRVATLETALANKRREFTEVERRLQLAVTVADEETKRAEQERRYNELVDLNREFHTRRLGFVSGYESFQSQLTALDNQIKDQEARGFKDAAEILRDRRRKMVEALELWMTLQQNLMAAAGLQIHRAYQQNGVDGIGPANAQQLATEVREHGGTLRGTLEVVDQDRVDRTGQSAGRIAAGAPGNTEHKNIFDNPLDSDAWAEFATDYRETFRDYVRDPKLFFSRYLAYLKGSGRAVKDGVLDLLVLGWEIVDT
ncbi:MAG: hypothetical protein KDK91_12660, partial [Gammaproteobacteria bacterium]|nr:hypothetical protein [Gammaproteobacteria bacterium]